MATVTPTAASAGGGRNQSISQSKRGERVALALAAMALSALVFHQGVANWLSRAAPERAASFAPGNARIAADAARAAIDRGESPSSAVVRALVDTALSRDLTLTAAIEFRALDAELTGDAQRAVRLFALSDEISRRSLPTRLWLLQQSVDSGDVKGALDQFDIALRTSSTAPDLLFPVLTQAASDPALAAPIAQVLDRPTEWRVMFLNFAAREAPSDLAQVVLRMQDRAMLRDSGLVGTLVGRLVAEGDFASARTVHDAFHPVSAQDGLVREPRFAASSAIFPFGWGLVDKAKAGAFRSLHGGRAALAYHALPGGDGQVATQMLLLPPGSYALSTRTAQGAGDPLAPAYWTITCAHEGGPQVALLDQPVAGGASASGDFVVPPGCSAQWLALNLRFSDAPQGQTGSIASVEVVSR